jgi:hemerythrin
MPLIQWSSALSVKVTTIDSQHQVLIKMINDLHEAMRARKGHEAMEKSLEGLVDYTKTHFSEEEALLERNKYPDIKAHKTQHVAFVKRTEEFKAQFHKGEIGLTVQVMSFLSDWLKNHIQGTDQKYSKFLNDHGVK